jgi:hypothetical protein
MPIREWIQHRRGLAIAGIMTLIVSFALTILVILTHAAGGSQGGLPLLPPGLAFAGGTGLTLWSFAPEQVD